MKENILSYFSFPWICKSIFVTNKSHYSLRYLVVLYVQQVCFNRMKFVFYEIFHVELITFSEHLDLFAKINTTIVACSVESHLTHLRWFE